MNDLADCFARHLADWATTLCAPADSICDGSPGSLLRSAPE